MSKQIRLSLDNEELGYLEDALMELPAKYANPILSWLSGKINTQKAKGTTLEEVTTIYVDTDRVELQADGIARKVVKNINSVSKRKITKL